MNFMLNEILKPVIRRLGSALGGALLAYGVSEPTVNTIVVGAMAAASVGVDLVLSFMNRRGGK